MLIDVSKIKTADTRAQEQFAQEKENAINARASQYRGPEGTDVALLERLLKEKQDDPAYADIWAKRLEIQASIPIPSEGE